jgi:hypothetical protein
LYVVTPAFCLHLTNLNVAVFCSRKAHQKRQPAVTCQDGLPDRQPLHAPSVIRLHLHRNSLGLTAPTSADSSWRRAAQSLTSSSHSFGGQRHRNTVINNCAPWRPPHLLRQCRIQKSVRSHSPQWCSSRSCHSVSSMPLLPVLSSNQMNTFSRWSRRGEWCLAKGGLLGYFPAVLRRGCGNGSIDVVN